MLSVAAARALPGSRSPRAKIVIEEQSKNSSLFPWVSVDITWKVYYINFH